MAVLKNRVDYAAVSKVWSMVHHMETIRCFTDAEYSHADSAPPSWGAVRAAELAFSNDLEALVTFLYSSFKTEIYAQSWSTNSWKLMLNYFWPIWATAAVELL